MSGCTLSTHVLDLERGTPAANMRVELRAGTSTQPVCSAVTNADGRIAAWSPEFTLDPGQWELLFHAGDWYAAQGTQNFHPVISIRFVLEAGRAHLHVPLLLNRFGYSTYRGS
jgi:5-hydroxyisourate hydrolase